MADESWEQIAKNIRFHQIDLSSLERLHGRQGQINSITQDKNGFIWMSSDLGVLRYDGHDFQVYQPDGTENGLAAKVVNHLHVDSFGRLWVATISGLSLYRPETDDFKNYYFDSSNVNTLPHKEVFSVISDYKGRILLGTGAGFSVLDPNDDTFYHVDISSKRSTQNDIKLIEVVNIETDSRNVDRRLAWLSTNDGVIEVDLEELKVSARYLSGDQIYVKKTLSDVYGNLWIGTFGRGLIKMSSDKSFQYFTKKENDPFSLGSNTVRDIFEDSNHDLWVALDHGGLNLYNYSLNKFARMLNKTGDPSSISSNQLRCLFEDRDKNLWIGSYFGGVNVVSPHPTSIINITREPTQKNTLVSNALLTIFQTKDKNIWIGSEGGLNEMNEKHEIISSYVADETESNSLNANPVLAIDEDEEGYLWLGMWSGGLQRFDRRSQVFSKSFLAGDEPGKTINSDFVWNLKFDKTGQLWIGTETGGVNKYDPSSGDFTYFKNLSEYVDDKKSSTTIVSMTKDSEDNLWIASIHGLYYLDTKTQEFMQYGYAKDDKYQLSSHRVVSVLKHSNGDLWVGTQDAGINILNFSKGSYTHLGSEDSLPSSNVIGMIEDDHGNIWAATSNGIAKIDLSQDLKIFTLKKQNGIVGDQFNREAILKDHLGRLYFGGISGLTIIDPDEIEFKKNDRAVVLTKLYVQYKEVFSGDDGSPLKNTIYNTDKVKLNYEQNVFSLYFSDQNYTAPALTEYQYRLIGYEDRWVDSGNSNFANYTNMGSGHYRFDVRSKNAFGDWNESFTSLVVEISPAPWLAWWAFVIYFLLCIFLLYLIFIFFRLYLRSHLYKELSINDALTNVYNRHGLSKFITGYFSSITMRRGLSLLVINADEFKQINDAHGHSAGDKVLINIANTLKAHLRNGDHIARWGGEEFVVLMKTANPENSTYVADKLRRAVESEMITFDDKELKVTVSIGLSFCRDEDSFDDLFKRADDALYMAKSEGRNLIRVIE